MQAYVVISAATRACKTKRILPTKTALVEYWKHGKLCILIRGSFMGLFTMNF